MLAAPVFSTMLAVASQVIGGQGEELHHWIGSASVSSYGYQVSGAGDVNHDGLADILIGEPTYDGSGITDKGSVRIVSGADGMVLFRMTGGVDVQQLGASLDQAGDVNGDGMGDFIVGAPTSSAGGVERGAVILLSGADFSILRSHQGLVDNEQFGHAVAGLGDINRDGYAEYAVGTPLANTQFGKVEVFSGMDGSVLTTIHGGITHHLGFAVSTAGDVDADGTADLLIGSPYASNRFGLAQVYSGATGAVLYEFHGEAPGLQQQLGDSVAPAGDLNLDGYADFVIGASRYAAGGNGSVFTYSGRDGSLMYQWYGPSGAWFGSSVSALDDLNGDTIPEIIVGAPRQAAGGVGGAGHAYVFSGIDGSLMLDILGTTQVGHLGNSVADAGDVDGDGFGDLVIGEPGPANGSGRGAVFVHKFSPFVRLNTPAVSAGAGTTLDFDINFPTTSAGLDYKVLMSKSGTGPSWYGIQIPIGRGQWTSDSYLGIYPVATHSNMHGVLDANGDATATMDLPAGIPWVFIGTTIHYVAIAEPTGGPPQWSSVALPLQVVP